MAPGSHADGRSIDLATAQEAVHRDGRLPDERAGQRAGRRASCANEGYELTDDIDQADTILYNTCSVRQHAEDKIYSALGGSSSIKRAQAGGVDRRAGLHGPEGPGADPQAALRMWTWSSGRASSPSARAACSCQGSRVAAARREPRPRRRIASNDHGQLRGLRRRPRTGDAAQPVSGVRPGDDGLRQVLHLLHRPVGPRSRAKPAASRDPGRGPAARRPGSQGDHAPGPDGQQLQVSRARRADQPGCPTCSRRIARHRTASSGSSSSPTSPTT